MVLPVSVVRVTQNDVIRQDINKSPEKKWLNFILEVSALEFYLKDCFFSYCSLHKWVHKRKWPCSYVPGDQKMLRN
jgi:hypothetical protein